MLIKLININEHINEYDRGNMKKIQKCTKFVPRENRWHHSILFRYETL